MNGRRASGARISKGKIDKFRWVLSGSDAAEAADIYRDSVSSLLEVDLAIEKPADFHNEVDSYNIGGMLLSRCQSVGQTFNRSHALARRSGIDHIQIILESKGASRADYDGRSCDAGPGSIRFTDLGRPFACHNESFDFLSLVLPRNALGSGWADKDIHGIALPADRPATRLLISHMRTLWSVITDLSLKEAAGAASALGALVGGAISGQSELSPEHRKPIARTLTALIRAYIDANIASHELTPDAICANVGVSRRSLYRLFDVSGGVAAFIWSRRLDMAFDAIARSTSKGRLSDIAYGHGFQSESHFSRAFRGRFGALPSELRGLVHGGNSVDPAAIIGNRALINDWVGGLSARI